MSMVLESKSTTKHKHDHLLQKQLKCDIPKGTAQNYHNYAHNYRFSCPLSRFIPLFFLTNQEFRKWEQAPNAASRYRGKNVTVN